MSVAAIIPTCNRPRLVAEAVASVLGQSLPVDEIIVVNDGDQPLDLAEATVVTCGPFAGPSTARNLGAATARSDVLLFLDDDDVWLPDHVARMAEIMDGRDVGAAAFTQLRRRGGTENRTPPDHLDANDWLTANAGIQGSNLAFRRDAFWSLRGFDEVLGCCEDMDVMVRAADLGLRYASHKHPTACWRTHDGPRITGGRERLWHAHRSFLAAHGGRMSLEQVAAFRERTVALFGVDPGSVPSLVWLLGPPGAGKTTWALGRARPGDRVMDCEEAMVWLDGADLGVRTAKRHLAAAIRATEVHRAAGDRRLFMTLAYFLPEDLGPLGSFEHLICLVPSVERWASQLIGRSGRIDPAHAREHARWLASFGVGAAAASGGLT